MPRAIIRHGYIGLRTYATPCARPLLGPHPLGLNVPPTLFALADEIIE